MSSDPNMSMSVNELIESVANHIKCKILYF